MTDVTDKTWELIIRCAGRGHKFFRHVPSGRIGVADYSGYTPDQTEDGELWVDFDRPARIHHDMVMIPVISERGAPRECWIGDPVVGGIEVVSRLGLDVHAEGEVASFLESMFQSGLAVRVGDAVRRVA